MSRVIFLGSKSIGYDCLKHLLSESDSKVEVIAVLTTGPHPLEAPEKNILHLCEENEITILPSLDHLLDFDKPDYLISVQYHEILGEAHLKCARKLAINLHMAPLPEYRGCNQFSFAILDQRTEFGVTIHEMIPGVDNGDVLFEKRFQIPQDIWVKQLYAMSEEASLTLFKESLPKLLSNDFTPVSQDSLMFERGTSMHYREEINEVKQINPEWPQERIARHIRATWFPPYAPPFAIIDGEKRLYGPDDVS